RIFRSYGAPNEPLLLTSINISLLRSELIERFDKYLREPLKSLSIIRVKPCEHRTIEVQNPNKARIFPERHHDFRVGSAVTSDVAGKFVHIRNNHRFALRGSRATHALAQLDAHTGRLTLKRTQHQLTVFQEVEPGPVQIRQRLKDQRREIRGVGNQIALAGE